MGQAFVIVLREGFESFLIVAITIASFLFYIALFGVNARAASLALEEGKITSGGA